MRISIDATPLLLRSAGVKNYVYYWVRGMRALAEPGAIRTFPFTSEFGELNHERSLVDAATRIAGLARVHLLNHSKIPWRSRSEIFHASHLLRNPPRGPLLTTTIYDMTCWLAPQWHTPANAGAVRWFGEHVMTRAAGLIAISDSTRQDAVKTLGLNADKVAVVYPGVPDAFFGVSPEAVRAAREKHNLRRSYALSLGTIEPRKNVERLLDAYAGLSTSLRDEFELVVAGPAGWGAEKTFSRLRAGLGGVRYLGYIPETDLPGLTAGATVFLYPSLYEGFGFPVAQAMAAGVAVVTSNVSSLPEISGGASILVDPLSVEELRSAMVRLLTSPTLQAELGRAGTARAQMFRWKECSRRSLEFFRRLKASD